MQPSSHTAIVEYSTAAMEITTLHKYSSYRVIIIIRIYTKHRDDLKSHNRTCVSTRYDLSVPRNRQLTNKVGYLIGSAVPIFKSGAIGYLVGKIVGTGIDNLQVLARI